MVTVLMLKAGVLVLDTTVRLYLGDSAAYLAGAQDHRWLPTDRSFTYSLYLERMVMAETLGLCAFVGCIAAACAYLASARVAWLPVVAALG